LDGDDEQQIHLFRKRFYLHGLCILPVYGCGSIEPTPTPSSVNIGPFAESRIDPSSINPLLSQSLWQVGDRVWDNIGSTHVIRKINSAKQTVSILLDLDSYDGEEIEMPMKSLRRHFRLGDEVIVCAGVNKGEFGLVNVVCDRELTILTETNSHVRASFIMGFVSLTVHQIIVPLEWVASHMIAHKVLHESHIAPGSYVRVTDGRDRHRTGHVIEIVGSMLKIRQGLGSQDTQIRPLNASRSEEPIRTGHLDVSIISCIAFLRSLFESFLLWLLRLRY
jgi:ribosomal protein L24